MVYSFASTQVLFASRKNETLNLKLIEKEERKDPTINRLKRDDDDDFYEKKSFNSNFRSRSSERRRIWRM